MHIVIYLCSLEDSMSRLMIQVYMEYKVGQVREEIKPNNQHIKSILHEHYA